MKRSPLFMFVVLGCLWLPTAAASDGLPLTGVDGGAGVVSADGARRFVTFTGRWNTTVARLRTTDGSVVRHRAVRGSFSVPVVAMDGTGSGLSHDGRTLVLIRPRAGLSQKQTRLVVLDAARFKVRRHITLPGDFSFDAISPDGSTLYLVNYLSLSRHNFDPTNYKVRALDTRSGRLLPKPIVDPYEPDEKMGGFPITRATSPDGRWAYTLYAGGDHPFVHALDTSGRTARCVDLDALDGREDLFQMKLQLGAHGGDLAVALDRKPVALVDTASFKVSQPHQAVAPKRHAPASANDDGRSWLVPSAIVALLALVGLAVLLMRGSRPLARGARAR